MNDTFDSAISQPPLNAPATEGVQSSSTNSMPESISNDIANVGDNIPNSAGDCLPLSNDARLEFITSYTLTSLRLKHDKWHKMMANQEYQVKINGIKNPPQQQQKTTHKTKIDAE